jgi:putative spermidine/putrescine transport system permease protein
VLIYLTALGTLFVSAFWSVNSFTGEVEHDWTLDNFREIQ